MTDSRTISRAGSGQTDFPFEWEKPEQAQLFWPREMMHFPDAVSPLVATFEIAALDYGMEHGTGDLSLPIALRHRVINSYVYAAIEPRSTDPAVIAEIGHRAEKSMPAAIQRMESRWREEFLPELKREIAAFRAFDYANDSDADLAEHVAWVIDRRFALWHLHFLAVIPTFPASIAFLDAYKEVTGSADEMEPFVLLQGFTNRTVEGGHALWQLSREAKKSPVVQAALSAEEPSEVYARLETTPAGRAFAEAFRAYLDEFGWRGDSWNMDDRTWVSYPKTPLATIRGFLSRSDDESPVTEHARLAEERERALASVREKLASSPADARAQFEGLLHIAQFVGELQEDHNYYIDQMLQHLARRAFVEAGKRMVARDQIEDPEDVLYLTAAEMREQTRRASGDDLRATVADRRASLMHWRTFSPPPAIGTPPTPPPADYQPNPVERGIARFFGGPPQAGTATEIRGNAGAKGRVSGIARVAMTLAEATALQSGEVLVCPTTAPPWTPLFATAAAVVTDTGGILSHCAIVAREFGIPAVVGTGVATQRIRTGQRVTVDGAAGTVTIG